MGDVVNRNNLCETVADLFDIIIDDAVIEGNPLFAAVLTDICNYARSDKYRKAESEMEEARIKFLQAKSSYFQLSILSSAVQDTVNKSVIDKKGYKQNLPCTCSKIPSKSVIPIQTYLNMGMSNMHLILHGNRDTLNSVGISEEFMSQHFSRPNKELLDQAVIPGMQAVIKKLCSGVLIQYGLEFNEKLLFAKMSQLPELLSKLKENVNRKILSIRKDSHLYNRQIEGYFECCLSLLGQLQEKSGFLKSNVDYSVTMANYACYKNEALSLKARILELQILNEMYKQDVISALEKIRQELLQRKSSTELMLLDKGLLLERYEAVGKNFSNIVEQFSELSVAIRNEKWALEQLVKREEN